MNTNTSVAPVETGMNVNRYTDGHESTTRKDSFFRKCYSDLTDRFLNCMETIHESKNTKDHPEASLGVSNTDKHQKTKFIPPYTRFNSEPSGWFSGFFASSFGEEETEKLYRNGVISGATRRKMSAMYTRDTHIGDVNFERLKSIDTDNQKREIEGTQGPNSSTEHLNRRNSCHSSRETLVSQHRADNAAPNKKQNDDHRGCTEILHQGTMNSTFVFGEDTYQNYLKHLLEYHPNAYAIKLLSHRMENDKTDDTNPVTEARSESKTDKATNSFPINPLHKRVVVLEPMPKVSFHPRKMFSVASALTWQDRKMLMRKTVINTSFYSTGNTVGILNIQLRLLVFCEKLKVFINKIRFHDGYHSDGERIVVETEVQNGGVEIAFNNTKEIKLGKDVKSVRLGEEFCIDNVTIGCVIKFRVFTFKKGIPRSRIHLAEAIMGLEKLKSDTDKYRLDLIRP